MRVVYQSLQNIRVHALQRLLSGYPTGSAISLFFFGLEISPQFAANSAVYNMVGLIAMQVFIYAYYKASLKHGIIINSLAAILSYLVAIWLLHFVDLDKLIAAFISTASILVFVWFFRPIQNVVVEDKVKLNHKVLLLRALCVASVILLITGIARLVGPTWSGLFSAFPTTLFPLMLIVHFTYDTEHVNTIIKNVPDGIFSLILYSLSVSIVYPIYGIYRGTVISFIIATLYLVIYQFLRQPGMFPIKK